MLMLLIGLIIGCFLGWVHAHKTVATECERLGSFFVGKKVFHCHLIEERKDA